LCIVFYYETKGPTGNDVGGRLGGAALNCVTGLGTGGALALLRFLMFIFGLAAASMVEGGIGYVLCARLSEHPARYSNYFHSVDDRLISENEFLTVEISAYSTHASLTVS